MTDEGLVFQPGAILHDTIVGAFRAQGGSMQRWCTENGVNVQIARQSTYGQAQGPKGSALLARLIEGAGVEMVRISYRHRMLCEAEKLADMPVVAAA